jgi:hypothetical protein
LEENQEKSPVMFERRGYELIRYLNQWGGGTKVSIVLKMMLKANMASGIHHGLRIGAIKLQKVIFFFITLPF